MIWLPILLASFGCVMAIELRPLYEWKYFDYIWNNESEKELAIATGVYNKTSCLLYDAGIHKDGKIFLTIPRAYNITPATLCTVSNETDAHGQALLRPYPSPEWHNVGNCSGMTNIMKFLFDECGNMWIVDSGTIGRDVICSAQIFKIDVSTDRVLEKWEIPEEVSQGGLLSIVGVRTEGSECKKILVIIADLWGSGYVIFDGSTSWRLNSHNFEPDKKFTTFETKGHTANITYGPIGSVFLDKKYADVELVLLWSFSKTHAFALPIQDLFNSRDSQENLQWYKSDYEFLSPALAGLVTKHGILFGAFLQYQKLQCVWLGKPIVTKNVHTLVAESEIPFVITSMKTVIDNAENEHVTFAANNYLDWKAGIVNSNKVNFVIYLNDVRKLTNGTPCQPKIHFVRAKSWERKGIIPLDKRNGGDL